MPAKPSLPKSRMNARTALRTGANATAAREKNLLRDLIDQSLLVQRANDDNINVDGDVIKSLDAIRVTPNSLTWKLWRKRSPSPDRTSEDSRADQESVA